MHNENCVAPPSSKSSLSTPEVITTCLNSSALIALAIFSGFLNLVYQDDP